MEVQQSQPPSPGSHSSRSPLYARHNHEDRNWTMDLQGDEGYASDPGATGDDTKDAADPPFRLDQSLFPEEQLEQPGIYVCNLCTQRKRRFLYVSDTDGGFQSLQTHIRDKHNIEDYQPHVQWGGFIREVDQAVRVLLVTFKCSVCPRTETTNSQTIINHLCEAHGNDTWAKIENELLETVVSIRTDSKVTNQMKRDVEQACLVSKGKGTKPLLLFAQGKIQSSVNVNGAISTEDQVKDPAIEREASNVALAAKPVQTVPSVPTENDDVVTTVRERSMQPANSAGRPQIQLDGTIDPALELSDTSEITDESMIETSFASTVSSSTSIGSMNVKGKIDMSDPAQMAIANALGLDIGDGGKWNDHA